MREEALCTEAPAIPRTPPGEERMAAGAVPGEVAARREAAACREAPAAEDTDPTALLDLLEPDQLVSAKRVPFGRRVLSPALRAVLWGLRAYVLFMLVVVVIEVVRSLNPA